ncbi:MAG: T9SS type A sorting domain-containing protein [Ignavibacteriales bacterium]|nr:T9SS type A sorting domain-containing protein [Ignavibacteriales bacterium]
MKNLVLITVLLTWQLLGFSQNDTIIKKGYVSLATLIVDYETYKFKGGNLSYYSCPLCSNDSLPFQIAGSSAGDYGDITFRLIPTFDTIFNATIIWMGRGQIYYPNTYSFSHPFESSTGSVVKPDDIQYFIHGSMLQLNDTDLIKQADTAWNSIDTLLITSQFSSHSYKAGIYLYPPTIGSFNPSVAKWIIFLYFSEETHSSFRPSENILNIVFYPNPAKNTIYLTNLKSLAKKSYYKIFNTTGFSITQGEIDNDLLVIDISSFQNGIYYLTIFDKNGNYLYCNKVTKF